MYKIQRPDGTLIVGAYRDTIFVQSRAQARQQVEDITREHGQFALISRSSMGRRIAVSNEDGYLYAESIQLSIGLQDLFFIERLDLDRVIVIVIKNGEVQVDQVVHIDDLRTDLPTIFIDHPFHVRVSGDVPIRSSQAALDSVENVFVPPTQSVLTWEDVPADYHRTIPFSKKAHLQDWKRARSAAFGIPIAVPIAIGLAVVVIVLYSFLSPTKDPRNLKARRVDPLSAAYSRWHSGPSLSDAMHAMASITVESYHQNGWSPVKIERTGDGFNVTLNPVSTFSSTMAVAVAYPGRVSPVPEARSLIVSFPAVPSGRDRHAFDTVFRSARVADSDSFLDMFSQAGWGITAVPSSDESGPGYRAHHFKLKGSHVLPEVLEAAARNMRGRYLTAVVDKFVYSPLDGSIDVELTIFTR